VSGLPATRRDCGRVFEYTQASRSWRERARVVDPQCRSYDEYGYAVALSGRTALIGAPGANRNQGGAYVIRLD
jgi:hypothetical protein